MVYVAGKKHYFGVGGGTRQFKHLVEDDGTLCFYFNLHPKKVGIRSFANIFAHSVNNL